MHEAALRRANIHQELKPTDPTDASMGYEHEPALSLRHKKYYYMVLFVFITLKVAHRELSAETNLFAITQDLHQEVYLIKLKETR